MHIPIVELTPAQKKDWEITLGAFIWACPFFSQIAYDMMGPQDGEPVAIFTDSPEIPIAATDGDRMIYNPDRFFKRSLLERVFIMAHEVCHCVEDHCGQAYEYRVRGTVYYPDGKKLEYDPAQMNAAQDYQINALLKECDVGSLPSDGLFDVKFNGHMSALDIYRATYKKQPKAKGGGEGGKKGGQGPRREGFDEHLDPGTSQGKDPVTAKGDRSPDKWKRAVENAKNACKARGDLPAAMERFFDKVLAPTIPWEEKLRSLITRALGNEDRSWDVLDQHFIVRRIGAPGPVGFSAGTVVVGIDTSGSIGPETLNVFLGELTGILEDANPENVIVIWCDAAISRVDELMDVSELTALRAKGVPGGGGTSFIPVFDWVRDHFIEVSTLVYLTDGYGCFPKSKPDYPVIWGSITKPGSVTYPWGEVVYIPQQVGE